MKDENVAKDNVKVATKDIKSDDVTKDTAKNDTEDTTKTVIKDSSKSDTVDVDTKESLGATETVTKDATKDIKDASTTEDTPEEASSTHDANLTTPSKGYITASTQKTVEDNKQHKQQQKTQQQPDHLPVTEENLSAPKEAWQKPTADSNTTSSNPDKLPATTTSKETVVDKEGEMKVEDMEDERQEIMEYVAVLEEEEQDKEMEEEQQEDEGRYSMLSIRQFGC